MIAVLCHRQQRNHDQPRQKQVANVSCEWQAALILIQTIARAPGRNKLTLQCPTEAVLISTRLDRSSNRSAANVKNAWRSVRAGFICARARRVALRFVATAPQISTPANMRGQPHIPWSLPRNRASAGCIAILTTRSRNIRFVAADRHNFNGKRV